MTLERLVDALDRTVKVAGLTNVWGPPIHNRINMLATGIKSPIGVKVAGSDIAEIDRVARDIEQAAKTVPAVSSALAERLTGGRYIDVDIDRAAAARYGLNIANVQDIVSGAIGGDELGETVEGLGSHPVLPPSGQQITHGLVAGTQIAEGPPMMKSENGRPTTWVYVDVRGRDLTSVVGDLQRAIDRDVKLSPGTSLAYSG